MTLWGGFAAYGATGCQVGHTSLQAWTLGLAALLATRRREPDLALSHLQHGMQIAPPGAPRVRPRYIAAAPTRCSATARP